MPPGYQGKPKLDMGNLFLWNAFWELNSNRPIGMGEGPIPSLSIRAFADVLGIVEFPDLRWFIDVIRSMDAEYLELRRPKDKNAPDRVVRFDDPAGIKAALRRAAALRDRSGEENAYPETKDDLPPEEPEDEIEDDKPDED